MRFESVEASRRVRAYYRAMITTEQILVRVLVSAISKEFHNERTRERLSDLSALFSNDSISLGARRAKRQHLLPTDRSFPRSVCIRDEETRVTLIPRAECYTGNVDKRAHTRIVCGCTASRTNSRDSLMDDTFVSSLCTRTYTHVVRHPTWILRAPPTAETRAKEKKFDRVPQIFFKRKCPLSPLHQRKYR